MSVDRLRPSGVTLDTNVVLDYVEPEASTVGGRSQRLFDAMFKWRVKWVTNQWLEQELTRKLNGTDYSVTQADAIDDLRQNMNDKRLLYSPGQTRNDDFRARLAQCSGEREHDIQRDLLG
jgi:predicted nucleic acid-binding protein